MRVLLAIWIFAGAVSACEEVELPIKQVKRHSELIFRGTVTAQAYTSDANQVVTFRVSRVWKGRVTETAEMTANTVFHCANPFRKLDVGSEFVVFASKTPGSDVYSVSAETGEYATHLMQELGEGRKPKSK